MTSASAGSPLGARPEGARSRSDDIAVGRQADAQTTDKADHIIGLSVTGEGREAEYILALHNGRDGYDFGASVPVRVALDAVNAALSGLSLPRRDAGLREALTDARDVLALYADPTGYTDNNGEQLAADETVHPGCLAQGAVAQIDATLSALSLPISGDSRTGRDAAIETIEGIIWAAIGTSDGERYTDLATEILAALSTPSDGWLEMREALDGYRAAIAWVGADSWDGCSDCIEILKLAAAADFTRSMTADEIAANLARLRLHGRSLPITPEPGK